MCVAFENVHDDDDSLAVNHFNTTALQRAGASEAPEKKTRNIISKNINIRVGKFCD